MHPLSQNWLCPFSSASSVCLSVKTARNCYVEPMMASSTSMTGFYINLNSYLEYFLIKNKTELKQWSFQIFTSTITSRFCSWRWRECGEFGRSDFSKVQANSFHFTDDGTKNTDYVHISDIGHFLHTLFVDPGSMTLPLKRLLSNYGEQIMLVSVWVKSYCSRGLE